MDIPLDIRLDPARLSAGADEVDDRAARMRERRDEIASAVERLRATWRGEAATRFSGLWEQWAASADEVTSALGASATALRHARDQLVAADGGRADEHARLHGRLTLAGQGQAAVRGQAG